mmetsp:Transcript_56139/g.122781  ORF Transcript_56139/g.122781 Transcript_56139/m.122781 type:complete len:176 (+) Transcript_56139:126-653(+)
MTVGHHCEENDAVKEMPREEKVGIILKDTLPNRSRWADIEVEDASEDCTDGSARADEKLAGRRQLGPRGGRRPKFPAADVQKVRPVPEPAMPAGDFQAKPYIKPQAVPWHMEAWGMDWGYGTYYETYDTSDWPSRADLDDSWRRRSNDAEGWAKARRGRTWGGDGYKRPGGREWY